MTSKSILNRKGFTLIEVLAVIVILLVLAACLVPVFLSARNQSHEVSALSGLRELWMATEMYMQDDDLQIPPTSVERFKDDPKIRPLLWSHDTPWEHRTLGPPPTCPFIGDYVYARYFHPLNSPEGFDFWRRLLTDSRTALFISLRPSYKELHDVPANTDIGQHACSDYEPKMVSRWVAVHLDGSARMEHFGPTGRSQAAFAFFSYSHLVIK